MRSAPGAAAAAAGKPHAAAPPPLLLGFPDLIHFDAGAGPGKRKSAAAAGVRGGKGKGGGGRTAKRARASAATVVPANVVVQVGRGAYQAIDDAAHACLRGSAHGAGPAAASCRDEWTRGHSNLVRELTERITTTVPPPGHVVPAAVAPGAGAEAGARPIVHTPIATKARPARKPGKNTAAHTQQAPAVRAGKGAARSQRASAPRRPRPLEMKQELPDAWGQPPQHVGHTAHPRPEQYTPHMYPPQQLQQLEHLRHLQQRVQDFAAQHSPGLAGVPAHRGGTMAGAALHPLGAFTAAPSARQTYTLPQPANNRMNIGYSTGLEGRAPEPEPERARSRTEHNELERVRRNMLKTYAPRPALLRAPPPCMALELVPEHEHAKKQGPVACVQLASNPVVRFFLTTIYMWRRTCGVRRGTVPGIYATFAAQCQSCRPTRPWQRLSSLRSSQSAICTSRKVCSPGTPFAARVYMRASHGAQVPRCDGDRGHGPKFEKEKRPSVWGRERVAESALEEGGEGGGEGKKEGEEGGEGEHARAFGRDGCEG